METKTTIMHFRFHGHHDKKGVRKDYILARGGVTVFIQDDGSEKKVGITFCGLDTVYSRNEGVKYAKGDEKSTLESIRSISEYIRDSYNPHFEQGSDVYAKLLHSRYEAMADRRRYIKEMGRRHLVLKPHRITERVEEVEAVTAE